MTPEQRSKALALASKGVGRGDVARCLEMTGAELDAAMQGDRELARAFGKGRVATTPVRGYSELTRTCPPDRVIRHLSRDGITIDQSVLGSLRARCACGSAVAVVQIHDRGVSYGELDRIMDHLRDCGCPVARARKRGRR